VAVRLPKPTIAAVDKWAKATSLESRSEAIRRLVEIGLAAEKPNKP
jgi:metal-responsive CopG/Arc/MetJ family transcriptional regulator